MGCEEIGRRIAGGMCLVTTSEGTNVVDDDGNVLSGPHMGERYRLVDVDAADETQRRLIWGLGGLITFGAGVGGGYFLSGSRASDLYRNFITRLSAIRPPAPEVTGIRRIPTPAASGAGRGILSRISTVAANVVSRIGSWFTTPIGVVRLPRCEVGDDPVTCSGAPGPNG